MSEATEDVEMGKETTEEEDTSQASAAAVAASEANRPRKRSRMSPTESSTATAAVSAAAAAAGAQAALAQGLTGLYTLLSSTATALSSSSSSSSSHPAMPSVEQVTQAANRAMNDVPPYVHLSSRDSAPQLKIEDGPNGRRLVLKGGMRGYRMSRASHGLSEGNYYYEVLVLPPPPVREIIDSLPPNVRLGKNLKQKLEEQLAREEQDQKQSEEEKTQKKRKRDGETSSSQTVGGNVRIGWSMRTGDLQAPVGYDKWSYGLRDISGSRIHSSRREDHWGGEAFGPGDIVGFAICLTTDKKEIRFFKNGESMGHFVLSRGKREGGAAFENIQEGTYYPAISTYLGGTVKVNFGPQFAYPPRSLPSGLKLRPVSDLCKPPPKPEDAVAEALKDRIFKKTDESIVTAFRDAVLTEAKIRYDAYQDHLKRHLADIRAMRTERNLSTGDLPETPNEAH